MTSLERCWPARLGDHAALRDRLVAAYSAPRRGYHDVRHLAEVLDRLGQLLAQPEAAAVDRDTVVLAAWFHDAVYEGTPDDEEHSAGLAEAELAAAGQAAALVSEVARLVRLTRDHAPEPDDPAGRVLCDADLAILAADADRYAEYRDGVRREHLHLDEATFRTGRAAVLQALLGRPTLFHTELARTSWEAPARENLRRELAELA